MAAPEQPGAQAPRPKRRREPYAVYIGLFVASLGTTTLAGAELLRYGTWFPTAGAPGAQGNGLGWADYWHGLAFSLPFLLFLTVHEFGHYVTARWHRVRSSLPYYIPVFIPYLLNIGSFGAVIRLRETPRTTRQYFDIGVAGPLAGFGVTLLLLVVGFLTLPDPSYLFEMNPEWREVFGGVPTDRELMDWERQRYAAAGGGVSFLAIGDSLLYRALAALLADPTRLPSDLNVFHYPLLFVGYLTGFFTALNLLPIGQLDGGHVTYGLFGRRTAGVISRVAVVGLVLYGGIGLLEVQPGTNWPITLGVYVLFLVFVLNRAVNRHPWWTLALVVGIVLVQQGIQWVWPVRAFNFLWLLYALMATRFIGLDHPAAAHEHPLNRRRKWVGWLALGIFLVCFSPDPIRVVEPTDYPETLQTGRVPGGSAPYVATPEV